MGVGLVWISAHHVETVLICIALKPQAVLGQCGSWLACEGIDWVLLIHRGACIAGKPATTEKQKHCGAGSCTRSMWELACSRRHRLGVTDTPSCLHRRQASSHRKAKALRWWRLHPVKLWERACSRRHRLGFTDTPRCLHRRQASSHRKAEHRRLAAELGLIVGAGLLAKAVYQPAHVSLTHRIREQARSHN